MSLLFQVTTIAQSELHYQNIVNNYWQQNYISSDIHYLVIVSALLDQGLIVLLEYIVIELLPDMLFIWLNVWSYSI